MSVYSSQVPLVINHDWSRTKAEMKKLMALKDRVATEKFGHSTHYLMKSLGTLSDHYYSESWYRFSGIGIYKTMPWIDDLRLFFEEVKLNDIAVSCLTGDAAGHVDLPGQLSALNYIIEIEDKNAYTWLEKDGIKEQYSNDVNTAWIIDAQSFHGVSNKGERWSLSLHFDVDYVTLRDWYQTQTNFTFGDKKIL